MARDFVNFYGLFHSLLDLFIWG